MEMKDCTAGRRVWAPRFIAEIHGSENMHIVGPSPKDPRWIVVEPVDRDEFEWEEDGVERTYTAFTPDVLFPKE